MHPSSRPVRYYHSGDFDHTTPRIPPRPNSKPNYFAGTAWILAHYCVTFVMGRTRAVMLAAKVSLSGQREVARRIGQVHGATTQVKTLQGETAAELNAHLLAVLDRAFKGEL
jgi:hypothetical protein